MNTKEVYLQLAETCKDRTDILPEELERTCARIRPLCMSYYVKVVRFNPVELDDLMQAALIGVIKGIRFFDAGKGGFWPYVQYIAKKEIVKAIRENTPVLPRRRWHGRYPLPGEWGET